MPTGVDLRDSSSYLYETICFKEKECYALVSIDFDYIGRGPVNIKAFISFTTSHSLLYILSV
jgi:hypothetical protein